MRVRVHVHQERETTATKMRGGARKSWGRETRPCPVGGAEGRSEGLGEGGGTHRLGGREHGRRPFEDANGAVQRVFGQRARKGDAHRGALPHLVNDPPPEDAAGADHAARDGEARAGDAPHCCNADTSDAHAHRGAADLHALASRGARVEVRSDGSSAH
jgi:hypothetical protein